MRISDWSSDVCSSDLTLLDTYLPEPTERARAFDAVENIPSIRAKAEFCFKWIASIQGLQRIETREQCRQFLLNLVCFACCIEGLFRSEAHTSDLQSLMRISSAVCCLKTKYINSSSNHRLLT